MDITLHTHTHSVERVTSPLRAGTDVSHTHTPSVERVTSPLRAGTDVSYTLWGVGEGITNELKHVEYPRLLNISYGIQFCSRRE